MGSSDASKLGTLWDSHFKLRLRHARAMSFASLGSLSELEKEVPFFWRASMRRSSSASTADRSRGGSRPLARRASSRRRLDTTSSERRIGTACGRWDPWRGLGVWGGADLSGSRSNCTGPRFRIRIFLAKAKVLKKDLACFNLGGPSGLCSGRAPGDGLNTY